MLRWIEDGPGHGWFFVGVDDDIDSHLLFAAALKVRNSCGDDEDTADGNTCVRDGAHTVHAYDGGQSENCHTSGMSGGARSRPPLPMMTPVVSAGAAGAGATVAIVTVEIEEGASPRAVSALPSAPELAAEENVACSPASAAAGASTRNVTDIKLGVSTRMRVVTTATLSMMMSAAGTPSAAAMAACSDD